MKSRMQSNSFIARRAFTLIELLVTIAILALLIGLLVVAFSGALSAGKNSATESLMRNVMTGLQQFEQDFNSPPPLIDGHKHSLDSIPDPTERAEELKLHRYSSAYSLSVYLLGIGDLAPNPDEYAVGEAPDRHDGAEGPGIRHPGDDLSWGGARERDDHKATTTGRTYGPYIDIGDGTDVVRRARLSDFPFLLSPTVPMTSAFPTAIPEFFPYEYAMVDGATTAFKAEGDLYVIVDPWDNPIRYYKGWPTRAQIGPDFQQSPNRIPVELRSYDSVLQHLTSPLSGSRGGDPLLDPDVLRAPYGLLSAGRDSMFGDQDESNTDMVNVGRIDEDTFFTPGGVTDPAELKKIAPIKDNIRTLP